MGSATTGSSVRLRWPCWARLAVGTRGVLAGGGVDASRDCRSGKDQVSWQHLQLDSTMSKSRVGGQGKAYEGAGAVRDARAERAGDAVPRCDRRARLQALARGQLFVQATRLSTQAKWHSRQAGPVESWTDTRRLTAASVERDESQR